MLQVLPDASSQSTLLYVRSELGHYIGGGIVGGATALYSNVTGTFRDYTNLPGFLQFYYLEPGSDGSFWNVSFANPDSAVPLTVGAYERAVTTPFREGANGLDFNGNGRGCTTSGRFDVLEIAYGANGQVTRLAVDFEQHCDGSAPVLYGSLRINSRRPLRL
jgi:hypothetical protein